MYAFDVPRPIWQLTVEIQFDINELFMLIYELTGKIAEWKGAQAQAQAQSVPIERNGLITKLSMLATPAACMCVYKCMPAECACVCQCQRRHTQKSYPAPTLQANYG